MTTNDQDGWANLLIAFWQLVRYDLATGNHATRQWLSSPEFAWWASTTLPIEPNHARAALERHWQAVMRDPSAACTYAAYRRWMRSGGMVRR